MDLGELIEGIKLENFLFESEMTEIIATDEYETMFYTEASGKGNFFMRIVESIKKFFTGIIDKIRKKFQDHKFKKAIEKLKKNRLESLNSLNLDAIPNSKEIMKLAKEVTIHYADFLKRATKANTIKELMSLQEEEVKYANGIEKRLEACMTENYDMADLNQIACIEAIGNEFQTTALAYATISTQLDARAATFEAFSDKQDITTEKESLIKRLGTKLANCGRKIGNFVAKHQTKIIGAIGVAAGAVVTANVMKNKNEREIKKLNKQFQKREQAAFITGRVSQRRTDEKEVQSWVNKVKDTFNDAVASGKVTINKNRLN